MKRRLALTFAGSVAIVVTAGSAAVAANLGILGSASEEPVGKLDASSVAELSTPISSLEPVVVTVDEIVPVPVETVPVAPAPAPAASGDDDHDDDARPVVGSGPAPSTASTPSTVRTDNSGPGSIDDDRDEPREDDRSGHGGDDDEVEYEDD